MRDALAFGGIAVVLTVLLVAATAFLKPREWPEVTPRVLASDAEFWDGRGVRLRTAGMETVGSELRYRASTDQPYKVIVRFKSNKLPAPVPPVVPGVCKNENGVVVLAAQP